MYNPIDRGALKKRARELMREGQVSPIKMSALLCVIAFLLSTMLLVVSNVTESSGSALGLVIFLSILVVLVSYTLSAGYVCFSLGILKGERMPYASLFDGFSFAGKIIGLILLMTMFVWLWSLLFIIPGIVAAYRYSFALYNLCENPEIGVFEALDMSKQQTRGYKMELFLLQLSFFGWALLVSLPQTFAEMATMHNPTPLGGIVVIGLMFLSLLGQVFLQPYMQLSFVGFYLQATAGDANAQEPVPPPPEF